jgi:hypothetical protein
MMLAHDRGWKPRETEALTRRGAVDLHFTSTELADEALDESRLLKFPGAEENSSQRGAEAIAPNASPFKTLAREIVFPGHGSVFFPVVLVAAAAPAPGGVPASPLPPPTSTPASLGCGHGVLNWQIGGIG